MGEETVKGETYDAIGRIETKLDLGLARIDTKIDSLVMSVNTERIIQIKDTEGIKERLIVVETDSEEYKKAKNLFNGKFIDITLKIIISGVLIFLGFKEGIVKVFGF